MPNANGLPTPGDEVLFADGTTAVIKRYMRSRVIGYQDSVEPRLYSEDEASVPVMGHVVEMAKPCRQEFVTVITYLPSGFWQVVNVAAELSPDQRYEERFEEPALRQKVDGQFLDTLPWYQRHQRLAATLVAGLLWLCGILMGLMIGSMGCG